MRLHTGKGSLLVAAFDERIALSIPQESGSGGAATWRVSDWTGNKTQTLSEITWEDVWFGKAIEAVRRPGDRLRINIRLDVWS